MMNDVDLFAFEITLHARAAGAAPGGSHTDAWGTWPVLEVPHAALSQPMAVFFDDFLSRLDALERMFAEPDGSFVWASAREGLAWQVDGNAFERDGRLLLVDLKGSCPESAFDRLLEACGWPAQPLMVQLVRPAVFLEEQTFRRHALARAVAGDGERLRPG
jgi:hypothetical protein